MFVDKRLGNTPRYYLDPPKDANMRVPDTLRKSVVFLGKPTTGDGIALRATAFCVAVPLSNGEDNVAYLVTTKHSADALGRGRFGVRVNPPIGPAFNVWGDEKTEWWYHPTEPDRVDAAVVRWYPTELEDIRALPVSMFLSDELIRNTGIGVGDDVFMIGLFTRLSPGRNEPIIRVGNVAAMPGDSIPGVRISGEQVDAEAYLIEVRSMGGLSGSPVFVRETVESAVPKWSDRQNRERTEVYMQGVGPFYLMGLMHGHWNIAPHEHNRPDFHTTPPNDESIALGISIAVPAKKILEIINQPGLIEQRREEEKLRQEQKGPTSTE